MLENASKSNNELVLYVKINDFLDYSFNSLKEFLKYDFVKEYFLKLFDIIIFSNKLVKVSIEKRYIYCIKIETNLSIIKNILKLLNEENYICEDKYIKFINKVIEICKLNGGYIKYLNYGKIKNG